MRGCAGAAPLHRLVGSEVGVSQLVDGFTIVRPNSHAGFAITYGLGET